MKTEAQQKSTRDIRTQVSTSETMLRDAITSFPNRGVFITVLAKVLRDLDLTESECARLEHLGRIYNENRWAGRMPARPAYELECG